MREKDYSDLEGREIDYILFDQTEMKLKVVGVDYDIGITLVNAQDEKDNWVCFTGPSTPSNGINTWKTPELGLRMYNALFFSTVRAIKKGRLFSAKISAIKSTIMLGGDLVCAFTQ